MKYKSCIEIFYNHETFVKAISFLKKKENIKIINNKIIVTHNEISKLRANLNLILRCMYIHDKLFSFLEND
ncbi:MAG TPA: hypothetical protein EYH22_00050 [Candidatus Nanopusillus sp.]|nr:hypothetical protein [Candidatus Nanopusillus sp.]